jgi:hypothetical protein
MSTTSGSGYQQQSLDPWNSQPAPDPSTYLPPVPPAQIPNTPAPSTGPSINRGPDHDRLKKNFLDVAEKVLQKPIPVMQMFGPQAPTNMDQARTWADNADVPKLTQAISSLKMVLGQYGKAGNQYMPGQSAGISMYGGGISINGEGGSINMNGGGISINGGGMSMGGMGMNFSPTFNPVNTNTFNPVNTFNP